MPNLFATPAAIITLVVIAMSTFVLGLVVWKAVDAREAALQQSERDIRNLAHALAGHASRVLQVADVAVTGMVDLLRYQRPRTDRFDQFMRSTVKSLPQLREIGVLDAEGNWIYSSLPEMPRENNSDRDYFSYHRNSPDPSIRIGEPLQSTGPPTIVLSKRVFNPDGSFDGVVLAELDSDYFDRFYATFKLGPHAGITLLRSDGIVLTHWPAGSWTRDASMASAFKTQIAQ